MKVKLLLCAFSLLCALPCFVRAGEVEIPLVVVLEMESIGGFEPTDSSTEKDKTPPRPTSFRASINGNSLVIEKQDEAIPSAQATGCNVFYIGSDIISIQPYGEVTIGNGSSVIIDVEDEVTIKNDFQVQHGGQLLIR